MSTTPAAPAAGFARRLASGLYELLILLAVVFIATLPFSYVFGDAAQGWRRHLLQLWVLGVVGTYFVWFWTHGGQTLPMKTWRIRLVGRDGSPLRWPRALHRFLLSVLGFMAVGLGFLWALVDRERLFLHDRLAGTTIIDAGEPAAPAPGA